MLIVIYVIKNADNIKILTVVFYNKSFFVSYTLNFNLGHQKIIVLNPKVEY